MATGTEASTARMTPRVTVWPAPGNNGGYNTRYGRSHPYGLRRREGGIQPNMEDKDKIAAGATDIKGEDPTPQPTITPDELGEALERNQGSLQQLMPLIANKEGHTPGPMGRIAYVGNLASLPEISGEDSQTNTQEQIGDEGGVAEDPTPRLWQQRPCPQEPALQRPPTSKPHQLQPMFQDALDKYDYKGYKPESVPGCQ